MPRKRKTLAKLEEGNHNTHSYTITIKIHYKTIYFEVIDTAGDALEKSFGQKHHQNYSDGQQRKIFLTS